MAACPMIRLSPLIAVCLLFVGPGPVLSQRDYYHSAEPPLADGADIQLAAARIPAYASGSNPVITTAPVVTIRIDAPSFIPFNKELTYRLHVENPSSLPALDVQVIHRLKKDRFLKSDPKPTSESESEQKWNLGALKAGERKDIEITAVPAADTTEFLATAIVRFEHGQQAKIKIAKPELSLRLNVPKEIQQFDIVPLRLEVTNSGAIELSNVEVSVPLPEGVAHQYEPTVPGSSTKNEPRLRKWSISRLAPSRIEYLDFRIAGEKAGPIAVTALAVSGNGARQESKTEVTVQSPKLELTVTGPGQLAIHQPAVYKITIRNNGSYPMRNVTIADQMPAASEAIAATDGGLAFERQVQWIIPLLQAGETRAMTLTTKHPSAGPASHQFTAIYRGAKQQKEVTTNFEAVANLRADFSGSQQIVEVGNTIRYSLKIENTGSADATNVRPLVSLPDSLSFATAEPLARHEGGRIAFEAVTIRAGGIQVFTVDAKAQKPMVASVVSMELSADQLVSGPLRKQETTTISATGR